MCYTIEINLGKAALEQRFGAKSKPRDFTPRYVVSAFALPKIPVIASGEPGLIDLYDWGLIPFWTRDEHAAGEIRMKTFNARSETMDTKPAYREPFLRHRCLVLLHGFYEWHEHGGKKYPFYIRMKNDLPFAMAGIYDHWTNRETGEIISSVSIVTTTANPLMEKIHNTKKRMPVILPQDAESEWIDPNLNSVALKKLCRPFNQEDLLAHPVARFNPSRADSYNSADILSPVEYPEIAWGK